MGRWQPGARERLERAALELFQERGFAPTTVPDIAERAGLTTRTFFRHFADKREVLFAAEDELPRLVASLLADAPAGASVLDVLTAGLHAVATRVFDGHREELRARKRVVDADAGLRERELRKLAALDDAARAGLERLGAGPVDAAVAAGASTVVFRVALTRWLDGETDDLHAAVDEALTALSGLVGRPGR